MVVLQLYCHSCWPPPGAVPHHPHPRPSSPVAWQPHAPLCIGQTNCLPRGALTVPCPCPAAEPPANERVGSVVQRPQVDAPSVGNAPGTNAAAAAAAHGAPGEQQEVQQQVLQTQQTAEVQEASTGHPRGTRLLPPPPQFGAQLGAGPRQRQQLQPTASTGTSRPPAFGSQAQPGQRYLPPAASGRQASRLRCHSEGLDALQLAEAPGTAGYAAGSQAVADGTQAAAADAAEQQAGGRPPSAAAQLALSLQQAQPQATMLSGRGPSVLGDFMPGQQEQLADSEIAQQQLQQGSVGAQRGEGGGAAEPRAGQQQAAGQLRPGRRRQVDSNVGAIVNSTGGPRCAPNALCHAAPCPS